MAAQVWSGERSVMTRQGRKERAGGLLRVLRIWNEDWTKERLNASTKGKKGGV
jgi:hypothetical protein